MSLIGVVTYNHYSYTKLLLDSIVKYTDLTKNRVVIVDNGSTDGTVDRIVSDYPLFSLIQNDKNIVARAINKMFDFRSANEDVVFISNDTLVSPNWLEMLTEDLYRHNHVGIVSPYMPHDLAYDSIVDSGFHNRYMNDIYERLRFDNSPNTLNEILALIYGCDYDEFCRSFTNRNFNENMLDDCLTHVMYYKSTTIDKIGYYDEEYKPYGNEDRDYFIRMNNVELYRATSSRVYFHHWLSITDRDRFNDGNLKQEATVNSSRLLQKWEYIPGQETYNNIGFPSRIPAWKTRYPKFKLRDIMLNREDALKIDGLPYMSYWDFIPGIRG
jgi:GT2 family glycosyltransferase